MKVAILGYGNIGRAAEMAVKAASDMELVGIFHHDDRIENIDADVVLVCTPTREVEPFASLLAKRGVCTVDSFDIHGEISSLRKTLMPVCQANKAVSIISAGWDPGSDSMVRALMSALMPDGTTYTNFGPGRSMGHTVAAKAIPGVKDALSMTLPAGKGVHNRHVYIELKDGYKFEDVKAALLRDDYFAHDKTEVELVESVAALNTTAHGVLIERDGIVGGHEGQHLDYGMRIDNPSLTGQFMVSCARAAVRMRDDGRYGAYTTIELAPIDLLLGGKEDIIKSLV
ncbi:MAG: diaminopimelate dehydrogenase [Paludibacteraceae bacterium]|nr:diaminopimelate dehydrogenase [Paludibacteraceae bacterium]